MSHGRDTKAVNIGVNPGTGAITYIKPVRTPSRGMDQWTRDGPFAIQFPGVTPVQFQRRRSRYVRASRKHKLTGVVKEQSGKHPARTNTPVRCLRRGSCIGCPLPRDHHRHLATSVPEID